MPDNPPTDAERLAAIRAWSSTKHIGIAKAGITPFLLRLLDEREAEARRVGSGELEQRLWEIIDRDGLGNVPSDIVGAVSLLVHRDATRSAAIKAAAQSAREAALEEAAQIADRGAQLVETGPVIAYVPTRKYAADLAKDIAEGIRSLSTPEVEGGRVSPDMPEEKLPPKTYSAPPAAGYDDEDWPHSFRDARGKVRRSTPEGEKR